VIFFGEVRRRIKPAHDPEGAKSTVQFILRLDLPYLQQLTKNWGS
jgi:hypothetical protein